MLKKTIIYFFILVIAYSFFISFIPNDLDTDQSQWSDNIIKGQKYLYEANESEIENVIIGSSLSNRILTDSISKNFTNLAFIGLSTWDGLKMIEAKEIKPKTVFIEINFLLRPENKNFEDYLLSQFRKEPKKYIKTFQEKNQPVGIFKGLLYKFRGGAKQNINFDSTKLEINPEILKIQKQDFSILPSKSEIESTYLKLDDAIKMLQNEGIEVVFFEMPMHPEIQNSKKMDMIRMRISTIAQSNNLLMLPKVDSKEYQTTDGIHLDAFSALKFTKYLKTKTVL